MKQQKSLHRRIQEGKDFTTILPALVFLGIFVYYPVVQVVRISFTNWNLINDNFSYVGMKNWIWLFQGSGTKYLINSLKVTALYTLGELTITIVGGMLFAIILNRISTSFSIMRALVFLPKYVAMSSAAVVFIWILNTQNGILNYVLELFGQNRVNWLGDKNRALGSILMLTGWRTVGYGMMIYIASMRGISKNYYEAASIDGASKFVQFTRITLPLLSPTTLFLFVTTFISAMKVFQSVDVLTGGGPYRSTEVIVFMIYKYAMEDFRMDRASTVAVFFFIVLLAITAATMKVSSKRVSYDV
ncbi:carbohydrate ABC transporter permease [Sphaerochaeta globosa]|uniref:ABC-type transporter, integral membrane subunit n=1 Tax=Sphaerochaeta globosa (strain ATCC BAA-1886 / DSM 22777 / Buddy) TaxID=158189 RepID=F0RZ42_SPHGB|nr:sugar ABC transporter permease [Sphaerochaeta globosa]ADY13249.1 ABC-type transporter, integral membrane subunit [Sphaerochaeta globosa str. Buddy]